jgi:signal transduction histidine kinase
LVSPPAEPGAYLAELFAALLHDNVWQAFEIVKAPFHGASPRNPVQAEMIIALDGAHRVFVSTHPKVLPVLAEIGSQPAEFSEVAAAIDRVSQKDSGTFQVDGTKHIYFITPIADHGARLGHVVLVYSREAFLRRFLDIASNAGIIALIVVAVLLPINWYWGRRTAIPLVLLAEHMEQVGRCVPPDLDPKFYGYSDELGRLFQAYGRMLKELREKAIIEKGVIQSERLAALGQLSAGIAHEINNPLAGMLTAVSTLKAHGNPDARTAKTVSLLERGLQQIKDTVAALLVEAKFKSRDLTAQDVEDVRTLVEPQAQRRSVQIEWMPEIAATVPLPIPATLVRQIIINLLLNAIQAANERGHVGCAMVLQDGLLALDVTNDGRKLTPEQRDRLFEPFMPSDANGHGLGLWVTYQIVQQLGGQISVDCATGITRFSVRLPLGDGAR